jgi:hypothetical protein
MVHLFTVQRGQGACTFRRAVKGPMTRTDAQRFEDLMLTPLIAELFTRRDSRISALNLF